MVGISFHWVDQYYVMNCNNIKPAFVKIKLDIKLILKELR